MMPMYNLLFFLILNVDFDRIKISMLFFSDDDAFLLPLHNALSSL